MQFFDRAGVAGFFGGKNRGPSPEAMDKEFHDEGFYQTQFAIPEEAGKLLCLCRHLFRQERTSAWTMIIAESPGIWPSWEDKNLYRMMRQARSLPIDMAFGDGHLFDNSEIEDMISFSYIFANFRYDFRIVDADREIHAFFSHDDFFFIQVAEKFGQALAEILDFTREWPEKK